MNLSLTGKHALVCGGSRGIGFAAAKELAFLGAKVTILSRDVDSLLVAAEQLDVTQKQGHHFLVADLSNPESVRDLIGEFAKDNPVHILINNAGGPRSGPLVEVEIQQLAHAFATHIMSSQVITQVVLPGMKEAGYGRIINIISTSVKQPIAGLGVSNTIRGAMANWAKTLAGEVGKDGITVNNVLPGMTSTERLQELFKSMAERLHITPEEYAEQVKTTIPMGRFATPSEIANAIAFLASPAASYITGTNIVVDGGRTGSL
ncbi:MAG TPA: SDR family oxidoreductase [Saprospiraceae bacterium]|nr:SDR family oxidoreductase [Saprospiraceae bacterium]